MDNVVEPQGSEFNVRVFVPRNVEDAEPRVIGVFTRTDAARIVEACVASLRAEEIADVRWADVLASRIIAQARASGFDQTVAEAVLALAAIDRRPMGRISLNEVRYIEARLDDQALIVVAADCGEDRREMRRLLFADEPQSLAA